MVIEASFKRDENGVVGLFLTSKNKVESAALNNILTNPEIKIDAKFEEHNSKMTIYIY